MIVGADGGAGGGDFNGETLADVTGLASSSMQTFSLLACFIFFFFFGSSLASRSLCSFSVSSFSSSCA